VVSLGIDIKCPSQPLVGQASNIKIQKTGAEAAADARPMARF
jgi:hypothetical protein